MSRIDVPDIPFHIFARGNNKQVIFHDVRDRVYYLRLWNAARKRFAYILYTYALMDNHIHFFLQICEPSRLASLMHWVQLGYAVYYNKKYGHVGHVFERRYHNIPVERDGYFLTVDRYIHLNPVRAGMVERPEDYPWSSYRSRLTLGTKLGLDHQTVLSYFGQDPLKRRKAYVDFTAAAISKREEWPENTLLKIPYLGSPEFGKTLFGATALNRPA